ncbi:MAG: hypothetical protein P1V51_07370 [Deltaproteobacteria bacterium]|nr:hypothetical protein [Deltaproteobacteria bacterium]
MAGTARAVARVYGLPVSAVREAAHLSRLLPPNDAGIHVTLLWCASLDQEDLEPLAEHIERVQQRRPGLTLVGIPSRPPGPVSVMLSSRATGQKAEKETPRPDHLSGELGTTVIEVDGGPHTGLRRFLRCFGGSLMLGGSVNRVSPLALADLLSRPTTGRLVFWRVGADNKGTVLLRPPKGALPELRDPRATAALIHLRCPDRMPVSTIQETALAVEELVVDRADALLSTTSSSTGLGDIEVHAAIFRPALAARLKAALAVGPARRRALSSARATARQIKHDTTPHIAAQPVRPREEEDEIVVPTPGKPRRRS